MVKPFFPISALYLASFIIVVLLLSNVICHIVFYNNLIVKLIIVKLCNIYFTNLKYVIGRHSLLVLDDVLYHMGNREFNLSLVKSLLKDRLSLRKIAKEVGDDRVKISVIMRHLTLKESLGSEQDMNIVLGLPQESPSGSIDLILDLIVTLSSLNGDAGIRRRIKLTINHPMRVYTLLRVRNNIFLMNSTTYTIEEEGNVTEFIINTINRELLKCLHRHTSLKCKCTIKFDSDNNFSMLLALVKLYDIMIKDNFQTTFLKAKEIKVTSPIILNFTCPLNEDLCKLIGETLTFHLFLKKN